MSINQIEGEVWSGNISDGDGNEIPSHKISITLSIYSERKEVVTKRASEVFVELLFNVLQEMEIKGYVK